MKFQSTLLASAVVVFSVLSSTAAGAQSSSESAASTADALDELLGTDSAATATDPAPAPQVADEEPPAPTTSSSPESEPAVDNAAAPESIPVEPATAIAVAAAPESRGDRIEEIVVTANYRAQDIQDVVGSTQAFSGQSLDRSGAAGMQDYLLQVPSVSFQPSGNGTTKVSMRGISNINGNDFGYASGSPTVGVYLNDVAIQGSGVFPDLKIFDLDRIEVLKGPQGTLYGEGSMGGAIKMVTNAPNPNEWELRTDQAYSWTSHGDANHEARAAVNVPILQDMMAARIVGTTSYSGGFVDYTTRNEPRANSGTAQTLRSILSYKPLENLDLGYMFLYSNDKRSQFAVVDAGKEDELTNSGPEDQYAKTKFTIHSLTAKVELPFASLTSVSSLYNTLRDSQQRVQVLQNLVQTQFIGTGIDAPQIFANSPTHVKTKLKSFSQELRMVSNGGDSIDWIAGAFYRDRSQTFEQEKYENSIPAISTGLLDSALAAANINTTVLLDNLLTALNINSFNPLQGKQEAGDGIENFRQAAAYGEATWNIVPSVLELTGGLRVFSETVGFTIDTNFYGVEAFLIGTDPQNIDPSDGTVGVNFSQSVKTSGILPKLSLGWHITDQDMVYATISRGFRSGSANIYAALSAGPPVVKPDFVWNHEVGYKSTWLDGRLIANFSVYYINWNNIQGTVLGNAKLGIVPTQFAYLANAGDAVVKGAEASTTWLLYDGLMLNLSGGYNNGVLVKAAPNSGVSSGVDLPSTPKFTGSATLSYSTTLSNDWVGDISSTYSYTDTQLMIYPAGEVSDGMPIPAYSLLKAGIGLQRNKFRLQLFGDNIMDKRAVVAISSPSKQSTVITPRVVGVRMSYDF
ncbi:TonB-dependent receptor [Stenotrophobium rhamnosiphilum]|nr:TonB-dependent receptor [Stenotrophobium rhamnosiphilum]